MDKLGTYDVIVIGAGHAGIEAAHAAARLGARTAVFTLSLDFIGNMPCNPSIGGTAKGHLVREVDALGGLMGLAADATYLQSRMLNRGKGPAVHSLRVQTDRKRYHIWMKHALEQTANLDIHQGEIVGVDVQDGKVCGVFTNLHGYYACKAVVIATGTNLGGRIFVGDAHYDSGPDGTHAATALTRCLVANGFTLRRFKTGTPARVHRRSIDFSKLECQPGDPDAELVQGVKPRELYERYKQFKEIDETEGLSSAEKDELKRKILDGGKASERSVIRMLKSGEIEDASDVHVPTSSELPNWLSGPNRNRHAKKHAAEYGIDYRSKDGQEEYSRIMSEVVDEYDAVVFVDDVSGQEGQRCAVYFRGDDIAVVNLDKNVRVSLFKFEEGYSGYYTALWHKVHGGPEQQI